MLFSASESNPACLSLLIVVILGFGWAQCVPYNSETTGIIRLRRMSPSTASSCVVPPQPENGRWKLHREFCDYSTDCDVPQGVSVKSGSYLIYSCDSGYQVEGNIDVHCTVNGSWTDTPSCIEIKCGRLNTPSWVATCYQSDQTVDCDSSLLSDTQANASCRPEYPKGTISSPEHGETCNANGTLEPDLVVCEPVCSMRLHDHEILLNAGYFPWYAGVYWRKKGRYESNTVFQCGATIIRDNLLLTVAQCIYDEETKTTIDSGSLFVMTGNTFRVWDSRYHDPRVVQKSHVKNYFLHPRYYVQPKTKFANIALLIEIEEPFRLSSICLPACLDLPGYENGALVSGAYGKVAGFSKASEGASSAILLTTDIGFVTPNECKSLTASNPQYADYLTNETFCASPFNNSTNPCHGAIGSGVVFFESYRWFVMGILSAEPKECPSELPSIFTEVSVYLPWILEVMSNLKRYGLHPPGSQDRSTVQSTTVAPTVTSTSTEISTVILCLVPPPPENGAWRFHGDLCRDNKTCEIPQGTLLKPGSQLVYSCVPGYKPGGHNEIYCRDRGEWSASASCIEIKCHALNSVSTMASCSHSGKWVSCDLPAPSGTLAEISCHPGYKKDSVFTVTRRETVKCTEHGKWHPEPIRCVPVCGIAITHQTPHAIGATTASVGDFPWHASLYVEKKSFDGIRKVFTCGATIIHTNFLMTAAHCVYDESSRKTADAKKLFVMTGNIFRDWDYELHSEIVRKAAVKNVYRHSKYYGLQGNFASDIALLELQQPFNFSRILSMACLDVDGYSDQILEPGALGRVAGFGRTATGPSSAILQTLTVPYVTFKECTSSESGQFNDYLISNDKFCAGYTNGSAVCDGDSGGGLVFRRNDLWYVMGIVSVSLGVNLDNGEKTCDKNSYALYTKVSTYLQWIHDVIANPEPYKI